MTPLADAEARRRIAEELETTFVVEAAAGTGKTTALVGRVVALVRSGRARLGQIIAVTFTEKAAGEMKLRLRSALEVARGKEAPGSPPQRALTLALEELEVARIGTIHALCSDLLRERPVEAGVDPVFEVAKEPEALALFDAAFDRWLQEVLANPPEGVRRFLRRPPFGREKLPPRESLRAAAGRLREHRDFEHPWRRDPFDRTGAIDALFPKLQRLGALAALERNPANRLRKLFAEVQRFTDDVVHREAVAARDHDGLEAALGELRRDWGWKENGYGKKYGSRDKAEVVAERDAVRDELDAFLEAANADLAACLHDDLWPLVQRYEDEKAGAGRLDFFDLLLRLKKLLVENAAVRQELQERFTHLFVDEFQDTDPIQADILRLLAADDPGETDAERARPVPGKLFIVGDPKQSIYRFRRADVALYEAVKARLMASGAVLLDLTTSFRAAPALQEAINAAFAPAMVQADQGRLLTQARYVPLTRFRTGIAGQPSLVALPAPRPYSEYGKLKGACVQESYADAVAAFIDFLVNRSGWKVAEAQADGSVAEVPVAARHVCILFKRFRQGGDDATSHYTQALEARGLPHVLVGGRSLHGREEVLALRNVLEAVEWPDDELAVYASLKGPFFALHDDALLVYRSAVGSLHPFRPVEVDALEPAAQEVAAALKVLKTLHRERNRRSIGETFAELLAATRAHAGVAFWTNGEQALANLAQLAELGRQFEGSGGTSFRGFVELLGRQAERGEAPEAPIVEEGSEGVRMMTVHGAKGLEFPVVILADPGAPLSHQQPSQWVDPELRLWAEPLAGCVPVELLEHREEALQRDREEGLRHAYVAATRARDLLVVGVVGTEQWPTPPASEGWVSVLHPVLYPDPMARRTPKPAPGCPAFGPDSVLDLPADHVGLVPVSPGLHKPQVGAHEVVWWDPAALELNREHASGLLQNEVLREDGQGAAAKSLADYEAWRSARETLIQEASRASVQVVAGAKAGVPPERVPLEVTSAKRQGRPRGRRFGALVHLVLAQAPLGGKAPLGALASAAAKRLGAPESEATAAVEAAQAALEHPLLRRAAKATQVRREVPLVLPLPDGRLAEGVADLAFEEAGRWTVVDFKTDFELEEGQSAYESQLTVYATAIRAATGQPADAVLLSV
ncbi:MAG: UvrD-helicase domain-containing protein [Myxococcaceae bacterium]|nr:UvrD-helicase domain-containing protein [Myxococcaceae bacterium]